MLPCRRRLMRPDDELIVQYYGTSDEVSEEHKVLMLKSYEEVLKDKKVWPQIHMSGRHVRSRVPPACGHCHCYRSLPLDGTCYARLDTHASAAALLTIYSYRHWCADKWAGGGGRHGRDRGHPGDHPSAVFEGAG